MRILVYPHSLAVGGSQINAIELAAAIRDRGHEVTITAPAGRLADTIAQLGLPFVPVPAETYHPSLRTVSHLRNLASRLRPDIVHAYEWRPALEATLGSHLLGNVPLLVTILSMQVPNFLPRHVPLIVGTQEIAERLDARRRVHVLEPPIDTRLNRLSQTNAARRRWGFEPGDIVIGIVCRLTHELEKAEGVLDAMDAVALAQHRATLRLLVVGGGDCSAEVEAKAARINARAGRPLVVLAGELMDPRDGYAAADIVLGMGSSALKGMAFGRPLVVQGTGGFWRLLDQASAGAFLHQGWFGHDGGGVIELQQILTRLAADPLLRHELGAYGRLLVEAHFGLDQAAERLLDIYRDVATARTPAALRLASVGRSAMRVAKFGAVSGWRSLAARSVR